MIKQLGIVLGVLLLLLCNASADNKSDDEKFQADAQAAYRAGDYQTSIDNYLKLLEIPESTYPLRSLYYNVSCCYSLLGQADEAFKYLRKAVDAGFDSMGLLKGDADLNFLRSKHRERFQTFLSSVAKKQQENIVKETPLAVTLYRNYCGSTDLSNYAWDDLNAPMTDSLRSTYKLNDIIASGETEFDRILLMLKWVAQQWKHNGNQAASAENALTILAEVAQGNEFRCVEYGAVLANCLSAVGIPARVVGLQTHGVSFGSGKGHVGAEVWSNEYDKWIFLDGQNGAYWTINDIPLSMQECRMAMVNGKEDDLHMVGLLEGRNYDQMKYSWDIYFYHITAGVNYCYYQKPRNVDNRQYALVTAKVKPELFFQLQTWNIERTSDENLFYPALNQVHIKLRHPKAWTEPGDTLIAFFEHTTPWFDHYEIRLDDNQEWSPAADSVVWVTHKGENSLEARTVNQMNRPGVVSHIAIKNNL